jgi:hypothetical protein
VLVLAVVGVWSLRPTGFGEAPRRSAGRDRGALLFVEALVPLGILVGITSSVGDKPGGAFRRAPFSPRCG